MHHEIPELDRQGLRRFGLVTGGILAVLFGLFFPWLLERSYPYWAWVIGAILALGVLITPANLRPVCRTWMRCTLLLSRITTLLIMGTVYFLVITSAAFIMRMMGRDPMARRFDPNAHNYRLPSKKAPKKNIEKLF